MKHSHFARRLVRENLGFIIFMLLMFCFRSAVADWNHVPSGSMLPNIVEGDRIWVDKNAYDIRIPFTHVSLKKLDDPQPGDIVVFDSKASAKRLVKRVLGLPGDIVEMRANVVFVNGRALLYGHPPSGQNQPLSPPPEGYQQREETLSDDTHVVRVDLLGSPLSDFPAMRVPPAHYFVLGDNRDNSADSRVIGFVPRNEIVGRAEHVVMSLNADNFYLPRSDRFMKTL